MCRLLRHKHVLTRPFVPVGDHRIRVATTDATKLCTYNTFKYHVFAPMGRFQLELFTLIIPPSSHLVYYTRWDDGGK